MDSIVRIFALGTLPVIALGAVSLLAIVLDRAAQELDEI